MERIDYYMNLPYRLELVPDPDEGGYVVRYPDLTGCVSQGESIETALRNAEGAKREWIVAAIEEGLAIPEPRLTDDYSGQFKLRIPRSLHRLLAEHAKDEGMSMNQYCLYLLARNDALQNG